MLRAIYRKMGIRRDDEEQNPLVNLDDDEVAELYGSEDPQTKLKNFLSSDLFVSECRKHFS